MSFSGESRAVGSTPWPEYVPPAVLIVLALGFLLIARHFPAHARMVPELIGWATLILSSLDLMSRTATGMGRSLTRWLNPAVIARGPHGGTGLHQRSRQLMVICGVSGFVAGLVLIGVLPSVPLFVLLAVRVGGGRGWLTSILAAAAVTAVIWLLFGLALRLELFPGLLLGGDW